MSGFLRFVPNGLIFLFIYVKFINNPYYLKGEILMKTLKIDCFKDKRILNETYCVFRQIYLAVVYGFYIKIPKYLLGEEYNNITLFNKVIISVVLICLFAIFICKPFSDKNKYFLKNQGLLQIAVTHFIYKMLFLLYVIIC